MFARISSFGDARVCINMMIESRRMLNTKAMAIY